MDPLYEQRLREEVIFLHSLWHQGPPPPSSIPTYRRHLHPFKTTHFKKGNPTNSSIKRGGARGALDKPNTVSNSSSEWPIPTPPPLADDQLRTWGTKSDDNNSKPQSLSPQDQLKFASRNAHHRAQNVVNAFFGSGNGDDSDAIDADSDDDDEDSLVAEDDGREYYCFFFKVFDENPQLKEYYEKNFSSGEFTCLVCGASGGKKVWKKYKGCLPLVQHAISIAKTKRRRAHRALGQAICKVLGWDIDQLPNIASLLSTTKAGEAEVNVSVNKERSVVDSVDELKVKNDGAIPAGVLSSDDGGNAVC